MPWGRSRRSIGTEMTSMSILTVIVVVIIVNFDRFALTPERRSVLIRLGRLRFGLKERFESCPSLARGLLNSSLLCDLLMSSDHMIPPHIPNQTHQVPTSAFPDSRINFKHLPSQFIRSCINRC
jgi:hypothetical protein